MLLLLLLALLARAGNVAAACNSGSGAGTLSSIDCNLVDGVAFATNSSGTAVLMNITEVEVGYIPFVGTVESTGFGSIEFKLSESSIGFVFGRTEALQLPSAADFATSDNMFPLGNEFLIVAIDSTVFTFHAAAVATSGGGTKIRGLMLANLSGQGAFYTSCGALLLQTITNNRKRVPSSQAMTSGLGSLVTAATSASGDPHLFGANGIKFDVFGESAANYSLVVAPAFEVNMQLANRGPDMRFMTKMTVLHRGESFTITPWTVKNKSERGALIARFEALGAQVKLNDADWTIKITLCDYHTIEFQTHHSVEHSINYLNFAMRVPGCHDAYGGLLGQTYQCKYAHEKFEWSSERELAFRVPTLESPSGAYSPLADCAAEDEYRGEEIRGGSIGGGSSALEMTSTQKPAIHP